jgi:hypothetical protein
MRKRPITVLVAALALLAAVPAASEAQDPTPTATATAQQSQDDGSAAKAPDDASKEVKAIYTDYSRDGVIDVCVHTRENLQETLDTIEPDFDRDFPDFREAVEAGIQRHDGKRCDSDAEATATPSATASPDASATASPESGDLPAPDQGSATDDGGGAIPPPDDGSLPPEDGALPPAEEGAGAVPPAATPTVAPPVAAATPTPVPTPVIVARSSTDELLVPGILIGIALLGAALLAATAIGGRRSPRMRHAWSEAGFRTRGLWADFSDWLRIGR